MGNIQTDGKKRNKKFRDQIGNVDEQMELPSPSNRSDEQVNVPQSMRISFDKVPTSAKRPAPKPPIVHTVKVVRQQNDGNLELSDVQGTKTPCLVTDSWRLANKSSVLTIIPNSVSDREESTSSSVSIFMDLEEIRTFADSIKCSHGRSKRFRFTRHSSYEMQQKKVFNELKKNFSVLCIEERKELQTPIVPRVLDSKENENFKGQYLINWLTFSLLANTELTLKLTDIRKISSIICSNLLSAGVLTLIAEQNTVNGLLFRTDGIYHWVCKKILTENQSEMESSPTTPDHEQKLINTPLEADSSPAKGELPLSGILVENTSITQACSQEVPSREHLPPPPPPPPMPGMKGPPPPPPMPGMGGLPPPPMSESAGPPPPPPMPGSAGPPPPPMPGLGGPPPPPMPGLGGPPPPPMPGGIPPPPPLIIVPNATSPSPIPDSPSQRSNSVHTANHISPLFSISSPAPLPTPPPGGWSPATTPQMRKPALTPEVSMKPLYWTRLLVPVTPSNQVQTPVCSPEDTLWAEIGESSNLNMKEFENLFARQVTEKKSRTKKTNDNDKASKVEPAKILDFKRSKMVGILEKSLRVDLSDVENALYNLDTSNVSLEVLQQIYEVRPTRKELEDIAKHETTCPEIPLDTPELFLLKLGKIEQFEERMACLTFLWEFPDAIAGLSSKLTNLQATCRQMRTSDSLKTVMALILTLGNYMNGGNRIRGQADGFGLEILGKLKDVKSNVQGITLLHYVVKTSLEQVEKDFKGKERLPLPIPEPSDIATALTIDFDDISHRLDVLKKDFEVFKKKCQIVVGTNPNASQSFERKMNDFIDHVETELSNERGSFLGAMKEFKAVMKFYKYIPKNLSMETQALRDFFTLWLTFTQDFKDIWLKEEQRIERERAILKQAKTISKGIVSVKRSAIGMKSRFEKLNFDS